MGMAVCNSDELCVLRGSMILISGFPPIGNGTCCFFCTYMAQTETEDYEIEVISIWKWLLKIHF